MTLTAQPATCCCSTCTNPEHCSITVTRSGIQHRNHATLPYCATPPPLCSRLEQIPDARLFHLRTGTRLDECHAGLLRVEGSVYCGPVLLPSPGGQNSTKFQRRKVAQCPCRHVCVCPRELRDILGGGFGVNARGANAVDWVVAISGSSRQKGREAGHHTLRDTHGRSRALA